MACNWTTNTTAKESFSLLKHSLAVLRVMQLSTVIVHCSSKAFLSILKHSLAVLRLRIKEIIHRQSKHSEDSKGLTLEKICKPIYTHENFSFPPIRVPVRTLYVYPLGSILPLLPLETLAVAVALALVIYDHSSFHWDTFCSAWSVVPGALCPSVSHTTISDTSSIPYVVP